MYLFRLKDKCFLFAWQIELVQRIRLQISEIAIMEEKCVGFEIIFLYISGKGVNRRDMSSLMSDLAMQIFESG